MKAQSEIIGAVLVVLISIALVAAAYNWGLPLIQKKQDAARLDRISAAFSQSVSTSLPNLIESVANSGKESTFYLDANGLWEIHPDNTSDIYNNSISFTFFSKVSNVAANKGWISLTPGATCPPSSGLLGEDTASVVCERADTLADGFNITYIVFFRNLNKTNSPVAYRISLNKSMNGPYISSGKTLRIINKGVIEEEIGNKKLIITKINILLS